MGGRSSKWPYEKYFQIFSANMSPSHILNLNDSLRIAGASINRFYGLIGQNAHVAERMLNQVNESNTIPARVEGLQRRHAGCVELTTEHLPLFLRLTLHFLRKLTFGTFHVNLTPAYYLKAAEEEREDNDYQILDFDELANELGFIRVRIFSRFHQITHYQLGMAYN